LFKKNLSKEIKFTISDKSAFENLKFVNFVLCGHSSLAFEAMLCNKDSGRVISKNYQPIFDLNDGIRNLSSNKKIFFWKSKNLKKKKKNKKFFF